MKRNAFLLVLIALTGILLYGVWFAYLWRISMPIYNFTKEANSYTSSLYAADESLGHTMIPNTHGHYIWGHGDSVEIKTDSRGFRIGAGSGPADGGLLFLGDSFTLCEELDYSQSYPYLIGDALCQPVQNAAVSGYGYAQMILKARTYIEQVQPNAVVFQVSPWLAERAVTPYMPALFFKVPSPYYNQSGAIIPPLYTTPIFELTQNRLLDEYRQSPVSFFDKFGFVWHFTRLVFQKQYWEELKLHFSFANANATALNSAENATALAIKEISALCKGRKLVLLVMGFEKDQIGRFGQLFSQVLNENVLLVDADELLWSQPSIIDKSAFERAYCFWHGNPPVLVDYHFNAHANILLREAINQTVGAELSACH
jgi:hypothetical protein